MTLVAGVDSSTQSCKVAIRDVETGALIRSGRAPHPDGTEVDPEAWWTALKQAIDQAGGLADVEAISVAGQQHGMVLLDETGRVIRPALLWNDTRSATAASALVDEVGAEELARRTGSVPVASFTLAKLRWMRDSEPENAGRAAAVALPHDWLTWRLRGFGPVDESANGPDLDALTTDRSDASGTAYFNASTDEYEHELLAIGLGRSDVALPRVLGPHDTAGSTASGLIVGPGCGDNAAAALGLGTEPGDVVISIGTSGTVFATSEQQSHDPSGTVAGFADASGRFLPLIATLNAARVLTTIGALLNVDLANLSQLAEAAKPGADGVVLLPYFAGERTPNLPNARASVHGLSIESASPENIARAAIEGMLTGLGAGLEALRGVGVDARRLLLIGGGAQSPAVIRVAAQVFDARVVVPAPGEYVAGGAAVQAAWTLTGERPRWQIETVAEPETDHRPEIREQYERYAAQEAAHHRTPAAERA